VVKRLGRQYPRGKRWKEIKAKRPTCCESTGESLIRPNTFLDPWGFIAYAGSFSNVGHVHHLVPERFLRTNCKGCDPHATVNLITVLPRIHSAATAAENRLFRKKGPDLIGFLSESNRAGIPMERLEAALRHYGLMR
jgi:hypothetical protein